MHRWYVVIAHMGYIFGMPYSTITSKIPSPADSAHFYAEYGPSSGFPVMAFHGTPGSHLERIFGDSALYDANVRLIVVERPGYGLSTFEEGRSLLAWPDEVIRLADELGLEQFSVMGFSGGGPYAAACAYKIPQRLTHTALISSPAPFSIPGLADAMLPGNRALFELAATDYRAAARQLESLVDSPVALFDLFEGPAPLPDKAVLADAVFRPMYQASLAESLRQGMLGMAYDMSLIARPWGFEPAAIGASVSVWHGEEDINVPSAMGAYLARTIPGCKRQILAGYGHFLAFARDREMLATLSGA